MESGRLLHKVVLVTGGGRGIGRAIVDRVAQEGAAVAIADVNAELADAAAREIENSGGAAISVVLDVSDRVQVRRMVEQTAEELGGLDVAFNNAGVVQNIPFLELSEADWDRLQQINARSVFLCLQEEARLMISLRRGGKIINTASIAGRHGSLLQSHYSASKFAVISLTQSAARTLAPYGITVNAMNPGIIDTSMLDVTSGELAAIRSSSAGVVIKPEEIVKQMTQAIPLGRLGTPRDVAGLAFFLASTDSDYVTGQALNVCGGLVMD
jgi:meso-butanediol dehydrogenase/(S,S)-butanediol dehydrogenase/diacetyl reductase